MITPLTHIAGVNGQFALDVFEDTMRRWVGHVHGRGEYGDVTIRCKETNWTNGAGALNRRLHFWGQDWNCSFRLMHVMLGGRDCVEVHDRWYAILDFDVDNESGWLRDMTMVKMIGAGAPT